MLFLISVIIIIRLEWRGSFIRAAFDSQSVGRVIGEQLAREDIESSRSPGEDERDIISSDNNQQLFYLYKKDSVERRTKRKALRNLQVIGISVGAFAADSCTKTYKAKMAEAGLEAARLQLTLLDPFTSKVLCRNDLNA